MIDLVLTHLTHPWGPPCIFFDKIGVCLSYCAILRVIGKVENSWDKYY